jgi:hypothetical protein
LSPTDLLQVVPTTCYHPAIQQLDKITALLQHNFAIMYVALKFSRFGVGQQWLGVRVVLIV